MPFAPFSDEWYDGEGDDRDGQPHSDDERDEWGDEPTNKVAPWPADQESILDRAFPRRLPVDGEVVDLEEAS